MQLQVSGWYRLGLALSLNPYDLNIIEKDHLGDTKSQTCKMFDLWLRSQPDASYKQLIKALHEVGEETVATFLCNKYGKFDILYNHLQYEVKRYFRIPKVDDFCMLV